MGLTYSFLASTIVEDKPVENKDFIYYSKLDKNKKEIINNNYFILFERNLNEFGFNLLITNYKYHMSTVVFEDNKECCTNVLITLRDLLEILKKSTKKKYITEVEKFKTNETMYYIYKDKRDNYTGIMKIKYI
jgi:hypothetical protein